VPPREGGKRFAYLDTREEKGKGEELGFGAEMQGKKKKPPIPPEKKRGGEGRKKKYWFVPYKRERGGRRSIARMMAKERDSWGIDAMGRGRKERGEGLIRLSLFRMKEEEVLNLFALGEKRK